MTQCNPTYLRAKAPGRREFVDRFDGGEITTDAGALLLLAVEDRRGILIRLADQLLDRVAGVDQLARTWTTSPTKSVDQLNPNCGWT